MAQAVRKSEETRLRILEAALGIFRERGFEAATMREVAAAASVAVGAAYYYFPSKEALVLAFYERAQQDMHTPLEQALNQSRSFESRMRRLIEFKFEYFAPNRKLLGALSAHTDPQHPLSPFSRETGQIRRQDILFFERVVTDSKIKLPAGIQPYLPRLLWLYQMGLILFWIYDQSPAQQRTAVLLTQTLKLMVIGLRLAALPILRPVHRISAELLAAIYGEP